MGCWRSMLRRYNTATLMNNIVTQIFLGSLVIPITIFVQVWFIRTAMVRLKAIGRARNSDSSTTSKPTHTFKVVLILSVSTLWLLAALSIAIWIWAGFFQLLGCFSSLEESLYFSMVSFTTVGFGDVTLPQQWRILSGMIAANGLVLFGLNTAFLIEVLHRTLVREHI
jgi:hypothetical protein